MLNNRREQYLTRVRGLIQTARALETMACALEMSDPDAALVLRQRVADKLFAAALFEHLAKRVSARALPVIRCQ